MANRIIHQSIRRRRRKRRRRRSDSKQHHHKLPRDNHPRPQQQYPGLKLRLHLALQPGKRRRQVHHQFQHNRHVYTRNRHIRLPRHLHSSRRRCYCGRQRSSNNTLDHFINQLPPSHACKPNQFLIPFKQLYHHSPFFFLPPLPRLKSRYRRQCIPQLHHPRSSLHPPLPHPPQTHSCPSNHARRRKDTRRRENARRRLRTAGQLRQRIRERRSHPSKHRRRRPRIAGQPRRRSRDEER